MTETIAPLISFAFAASITPGPNNLMLMTSGANFGWRNTMPHLLGVWVGFILMTFLIGIGLLQTIERFPQIFDVLKILCGLFVLYLAWKIATAAPLDQNAVGSARPLRFIEAAAFQWINPKAVAIALTTVTTYASEQTFTAISVAILIFGCVNLPCCSAWILVGQRMRIWLQNPHRLRAFNVTMAALLMASMVPVLIDFGD